MAKLFRFDNKKEKKFLNSWFRQRTIAKNQNVILTYTGATGSGKTYSALSTAERWYKEHFNSDFPIENVCFSLGELAKRINVLQRMNKLRKGEILILEEAGANLGNLDFQNKLNKMFQYILQSFRSMNLILLMTLPVLTMLNKGARQLIHGNFISAGIDYKEKTSSVKPLFHQLNQQTGKSYWKYPRIRINGRMRTMHRITFDIPSDKIIEDYEKQKKGFVFTLTQNFENESGEQIQQKRNKKYLTPLQAKVIELLTKHTAKEVAKILGVSLSSIYAHINNVQKKGILMKPIWDNNNRILYYDMQGLKLETMEMPAKAN